MNRVLLYTFALVVLVTVITVAANKSKKPLRIFTGPAILASPKRGKGKGKGKHHGNHGCTSPSQCPVPLLCRQCSPGTGPTCDQASCTLGKCGLIPACSLSTCGTDSNCTVPHLVCDDGCGGGRGPFCTQATCKNGLCYIIEPCSQKVKN